MLIYSPRRLDEVVAEFANRHGLSHVCRLLQRGAQLARDKNHAMAVDTALSQEERDALDEEENSGFWNQSKYLRASIIMASLAGMIQGWTQSNSNAANEGIAADFNLHIGPDDPDKNTRDLWLFGLLNATLFFSAGLL